MDLLSDLCYCWQESVFGRTRSCCCRASPQSPDCPARLHTRRVWKQHHNAKPKQQLCKSLYKWWILSHRMSAKHPVRQWSPDISTHSSHHRQSSEGWDRPQGCQGKTNLEKWLAGGLLLTRVQSRNPRGRGWKTSWLCAWAHERIHILWHQHAVDEVVQHTTPEAPTKFLWAWQLSLPFPFLLWWHCRNCSVPFIDVFEVLCRSNLFCKVRRLSRAASDHLFLCASNFALRSSGKASDNIFASWMASTANLQNAGPILCSSICSILAFSSSHWLAWRTDVCFFANSACKNSDKKNILSHDFKNWALFE